MAYPLCLDIAMVSCILSMLTGHSIIIQVQLNFNGSNIFGTMEIDSKYW